MQKSDSLQTLPCDDNVLMFLATCCNLMPQTAEYPSVVWCLCRTRPPVRRRFKKDVSEIQPLLYVVGSEEIGALKIVHSPDDCYWRMIVGRQSLGGDHPSQS